ncbi:MAG: response regulator transcription factor [Anaerolineae bacterium]
MKHILVVDDEEHIAKTIEHALRDIYKVTLAYSGVAALKVARRLRPDLVILDVRMPGMDGYEVCRRLRNDPLLSEVPILFLTALDNVESRIEGFEVGADDYLSKPFDIRELLLRLQALLRRVSHREAETENEGNEEIIIHVGDLRLNCKSFELVTRDRSVHLTPVEFDLLYHFMSHPGEIFTSDRLLQEVWDYPSDTGSPDLVRMHIKNIRAKIERDPSKPALIKTVPRHGYMMPPPGVS